MLRALCPALRLRVVNVTDLMVLGESGSHPHALSDDEFTKLFTEEKPVLFNYHGYSTELRGLLFGRPRLDRVVVQGYQEEGTTTTPLAMLVLNKVSRYDVAKFAIQAARGANPEVDSVADRLLQEIDNRIEDFWKFINENGKDPDDAFEKPQLIEK
ncbi:hypothetical protein FRC16_008396 [Serendipita sp. 398]|nr:hypothetical protein FRC16_008396 [Serendipita sp. 398]